MYAVIKTGGKQYKVAKNDVLVVEKLKGETGDQVAFEKVLLVGEGEETSVGKPLVEGATVVAEVVEQTRGAKIIVFKKKRRHNYRRTKGHKQDLTVVKIVDILTGGKAPSLKKAAAKEESAATDEAPAKKAAAKKPAAKKAPAKKAEAKKPAAKKAAAKKTAAKKAPAKKTASSAKKDAGKDKE